MATDKQVSWLVAKIKGDPDLNSVIPTFFQEVKGQQVNYTYERLRVKLSHITKIDAHNLINNIIEDNLESVKRFLIELY